MWLNRIRELVWYLILGLIVRVLVAVRNQGWFIDDTYIYWRYADNFARGDGFAYNPGEFVLGFTSPLFMGLVGLVHTILPEAAYGTFWIAFGIACFGMSLVLMNDLLRDASPLARHVVLVLLTFYFPFVDAAVQGMETPLFLVAILWCFHRALRGGGTLSLGLAVAAVILMRPEGILVAAAAGVAVSLQSPRRFSRALLVALLPLVAWVTLATVYYGSPIPNSASAKGASSVGAITSIEDASLYVVCLASGLSDSIQTSVPGPALIFVAVLLLTFLFSSISRIFHERSVIGMVGFGSLILYLLFYFVGQPGRLFSWYGIPSAMLYFLVLAHGLPIQLAELRPTRRALVMCAVPIIAVSAYLEDVRRDRMLAIVEQRSLAASEWIESNSLPSDWICTTDIGYIGWRTDRPIADLGGLVSRDIAEAHRRQDAILPFIMDRYSMPKAFLFKNWTLGEKNVVELFMHFRAFEDEVQQEKFRENYERLDRVEEERIGMVVYVRRVLAKHLEKQDDVAPDLDANAESGTS